MPSTSTPTPGRERLLLVGWWALLVAIVTAGYTAAVTGILNDQGQAVAAVGVGFAMARLLAREVGRRYPHHVPDRKSQRRAYVQYWTLALAGFAIFGADWIIATQGHPFHLGIFVTGAATGLAMNISALVVAFRSGTQDFSHVQNPR